MITGLNDNVIQGGIEYHVQTEDLGRQNPCILTLVFRSGAVVSRETTNYRDALGEAASETQIKVFMTRQHRRVIRRIRDGYCEDARPSNPLEDSHSPFAPLLPDPEESPADTSLDQLIAEYVRTRTAKSRR